MCWRCGTGCRYCCAKEVGAWLIPGTLLTLGRRLGMWKALVLGMGLDIRLEPSPVYPPVEGNPELVGARLWPELELVACDEALWCSPDAEA